MGRTTTALGVLAAGFVPTVAISCGGLERPRDPVAVRDSAGIEIVESVGPTWNEGEEWRVAAEPTVVIGTVEGEDAYQLSRVAGAVRLSDGRIVVLDSEAHELRLFGPDGIHLRTVGGPGEGPGEFSYAGSLERLPGDILQVGDRLQRVRFAPDGTLVSEETLDWAGMTELGSFVVECGAGLPLFYRDVALVCPRTSNDDLPDEGLHRPLDPIVSVPFDLSRSDTLGVLLGIEQYALPRGGWREFVIHPLYSRGVVGLDPRQDRLYLGETGRYDIRVWTLDGELERVIRRPGAARPPTAEELETGYEQAARYLRGEGDPAAIRGRIHVPDSVPPIRSLTVDAGGHLWVGTRGQGPEGTNVYEVFDGEGRLLGGVELPPLLPLDIGTDYVLGVRYDDLGVPFVVQYALSRGGE